MNTLGAVPNSLFATMRSAELGELQRHSPVDLPQTNGTSDATFASILDKAVGRVDNLQQQADVALSGLASGQNVDLHGTMIALEQADIALRTAVSVRDKFVQAYEQIMQMAI